jgi:hypothetical protein
MLKSSSDQKLDLDRDTGEWSCLEWTDMPDLPSGSTHKIETIQADMAAQVLKVFDPIEEHKARPVAL